MKTVYVLSLLLTLAALAPAQDNPVATTTMRLELETVARVGSVMVDGDVCQKIVTPRAKQFMFKADPRDQWLAGDNYDVDDVSFNTTKKTLIRLSHLTSFTSAHFNLALAYLKSGNEAAARPEFETACKLDPAKCLPPDQR